MTYKFTQKLVVSKSKISFKKANLQIFLMCLTVLAYCNLANAQQDIDINQVISPAACTSSPGSYVVTIDLINNGTSNLNGVPVGIGFSTDGGINFSTPELFIPTSMASSGDIESFTFAQQVNLTSAQDYNFVVRLSAQLSGDPDLVDQLATTIRVMTNFVIPSVNTCVGSDVVLTESSNPIASSWQWDFGDGNSANVQNPNHFYADTGTYIITLQSSGGVCSGTTTRSITVRPPVGSFTLSPQAGCSIPLTVAFTDQSTLPDTWQWDFGDGNTSSLQNPVHNYTAAGEYTVSLFVTDTIFGCSSSEEALVIATVPTAEFNNSLSTGSASGCSPLTLNFQDVSFVSGSSSVLPTSWLWDFGDGNTSTLQNPSHTYSNSVNGFFDVSLTVTFSNGCTDTEIKTNYVEILGPEIDLNVTNGVGCAPITAQFSDNSTLPIQAVSYLWDFGDGNTSSIMGNVNHNYISADTFDVTLTITDLFGCSRSRTYNNIVNTLDITPPTISCPSSLTINNDVGQCGGSISFSPPSGSDNCGVASVVLTAGLPSGSLYPTGITTNTYLVTDNAGNTGTCSHDITVVDVELPIIACPSDVNLDNDSGLCGAVVSFAEPTSTDNCPLSAGSIIQTAGLPSGSIFPIGITTNIFEVTDDAGNTATCSFDVVISDIELPNITCLSNIAQNNDLGICGAIVTYLTPVGSDNCPGSVTIQTAGLPSGSLFPEGTTTNTFEVTDVAGNVTSCSFDVIISDTEAPIITCPADIAQNNDLGLCGAIVTFNDVVSTENCSEENIIQIAGFSSGSIFPIGTTTNIFEATDDSGNMSTCSFDVVILDAEFPTIACPSDIVQNNDAGVCGAVINYNIPVGADNCPGSVTTQTGGLADGSIFPVGITTNTFEVTDASGNMTTCSFDVVISDTEFPTIVCPSDIALSNDLGVCGAIVNYTVPVGADNCPGASTVQTAGLPSGSLYPIGTTTNTFEVIDASGNTVSCSFDVIISDTEFPTITCLSDIAQNNDLGDCGAIVNYTVPVGSDNCPGSVTIQTAGLPAGSLFPEGTTTNSFEVTDAAGNVTTCSFNVVISDTEAPIITCPADIAQNNDLGLCGAVVSFTSISRSDNCGEENTSLTQIAGLPNGSLYPIGTTTNTFQLADQAGNTSTCSFNVTVADIEFPTITCPSDIALNNDVGVCGAIVSYIVPVGADNCPGSVTVQTAGLANGSVFPIGSTTNTFEVTDAFGNITTCSFNVVISDTELPTITCPSDIALNNDLGVCGAIVNYNVPVGADNCPGAGTVQVAGLPSGSIHPIGTTTNTFEVTDASGNTVTCSFDVVISDTELPTINCVGDIAQNNDLGVCGATVSYVTPTGGDNCPGSVTIQTAGLSDGSVFPIGSTTNTFEVTDASGNITTCSFDVVISDTELPTITCVSDIAQNNDIGICGAVVNYTTPVGIDNCPGSVTVQTAGLSDGSVFPIGTTTNTFEVTDASGNVATCSFDVVISDTEFPTIPCPTNITLNNDLGVCGAIVNYITPLGTDNCPGSVTIQTAGLADGSVFPIGTTTNTFEVTDAAGNVTNCSFDVVVIDTELPIILCIPDIAQSNDIGQCSAIVTFSAPVGIDNCPGSVTVQTAGLASGSPYPIGITTNIFEVTDAAGNTANCSFDVVISDTEIPTITCSGNIAQNNDVGVCGATVNYSTPAGTDNCAGSVTTQTAGLADGSVFPVGITTNTFEVTDAAGNISMCSFDVIISDTEFPTITCPVDIVQDNDAGQCGATVNYSTPLGTDNCAGSVTVQIAGLPTGDLFPVGTTTNTFEVTDPAGNVTACSFDVIITDTELPTIICPNDTIINNDTGICGAIFTYSAPVGLDNCLGPITTQIAGLATSLEYPLGITSNTFEVIDMAGNSASCSFDVNVIDAELPTIICSQSFESCDSVLTVNDPEIADNCINPIFELTTGLPSESIFPVGITLNEYTVTDGSGNQATCEVEITRFALPVVDAGPDLIVDAGKQVLIDASGSNIDIFEWSPMEGLDDSGVEDPEAGPMFTTEYTVRVLSEDDCEAFDTINITVNLVIEANNFMSPNSDGKNDTWIIKGNYLLDDCTIKIYSSWGNPVYESEGYDNSWDGTFSNENLPAGNYYYVISCGSTEPVTGSITLIR